MDNTVEKFIGELSKEGRILLIGGLAVIAHGLSRATKDADIWFEPFDNEQLWAGKINRICGTFENVRLFDVFESRTIKPDTLVEYIVIKKMIRINGLERPLDIFREPNNLNKEDFEQVYSHSTKYYNKCKIMDEIDLLLTKDDTGRKYDIEDQVFLRAKINSDIQSTLEHGTYQEIEKIFERYIDLKSCEAALKNPDPEVKKLAYEMVKLIAEDGDVYAQVFLERINNA